MESSDLIVGGRPEVDCYRVLEKMLMFSRERSKLCCYEIDATGSSRRYCLKHVFFCLFFILQSGSLEQLVVLPVAFRFCRICCVGLINRDGLASVHAESSRTNTYFVALTSKECIKYLSA